MPLTTCSECQWQVSTLAQSCPHCGYPFKRKEENFASDLKRVKKVGWIVALLMSLPLIAAPAFVGKLLKPGELAAEDVKTIWTTLAFTTPMTISVAASALALCYRAWTWRQTITVVILAFILTSFAMHFAFGIGPDPGDFGEYNGWPAVFIDLVAAYLKLYGAVSFCSSLIVGAFLGWAWFRLMSHIKTVPSAVRDWVNE